MKEKAAFLIISFLFFLNLGILKSQEIDPTADTSNLTGFFKIELNIDRSFVLENDSINVTIGWGGFTSYTSELKKISKKDQYKRICKHWYRDTLPDSTYLFICNKALGLDFSSFREHIFDNCSGFDGDIYRIKISSGLNKLELSIWEPPFDSSEKHWIELKDLIASIMEIGQLDKELIKTITNNE